MNIAKTFKSIVGPLYRSFFPYPTQNKYDQELGFWIKEYTREGGKFENDWYEKLMLAMAGENDDEFIHGKIVADFGCGPRGSLQWAIKAKERIGLDILADKYSEMFDLAAHNMRYIANTESRIPLPSDYVDVLFTINAMDHVDDFSAMCNELIRILKPGGEFIGSFNLHEPPTPCEPQSLDEEKIHKCLLRHLVVRSYRTAPRGPEENRYLYFWENKPLIGKEEGFLWVRATKPLERS
ncbi:MAG: class I SAM-dependent methyltransferase [Thiobacillaceae bacterium]|nr:class I SAM-dependent methyltransferase [Thiobacillaceae bacterium]